MARESPEVLGQLKNQDCVAVESQLLLEREAFRKALAGYLNQFQNVVQNICREYEMEIQHLQDQNIDRSSVSSLSNTTNSKPDGIQQHLTARMDMLFDEFCALATKLDRMQTENRAADKRTHSLLAELGEKMEKTVSETILKHLTDARVAEPSKTAENGSGGFPRVETAPQQTPAFLSTTERELTVSQSSSVSFPPSLAEGGQESDSWNETEEVLAKLNRKCAVYFPFYPDQTKLESLCMALDLIINLEDKLDGEITTRNALQESFRKAHEECEAQSEKVKGESDLEQHEEWKGLILDRLSALQNDLKEQKAENTVLKDRLEESFVRMTLLEQEKSEKKADMAAVSSKVDDMCLKINEQSVHFEDRLSALYSQLDEISDSVDESLEEKCATLHSDLETEMQQLQRTISQDSLGRYVQLKTYESDETSWHKAYESQRSCVAVQLDQMAQEIKKAVDLGRTASTSQIALTGRLDVLCEKANDLSAVSLKNDQGLSELSSVLDENIGLIHETLQQKCADLQSELREGLQSSSKANLKRFVLCKVYESDVKARNAACESQNQDLIRQLREMESEVKQKASVSRNSVTKQSAVVEKYRSDVETLKQQMTQSLALVPRTNAMLVKLSVSKNMNLLGDILLRLHYETVPETANEFYKMCVGQHGAYHLQGGDIFRVIPGNGIWFRPCGYVAKDGTDRKAPSTPVPAIPLRGKGHHSKAGLVSVSVSGWPCCMITLGPAVWLDGVNTVVGEIIQGLEWIRYIETHGGLPNGDVKFRLPITHCSPY